jgi:cytochrome c551/c552
VLNAVYNPTTQRFALAWRGDLVKWTDYRFSVVNGVQIGSDKMASLSNGPILSGARYLGLYRKGERVVFAYEHEGKKQFKTAVVEGGKVVEKILGEADATQTGEAQWPQRIKTRGRLGDHHPYAIDTLTLPYENPWNALLFVGGMDFVSANRIALCTLLGDVWVCDVADDQLTELTWKRYATGLYEPLGVKVVNGVIHVMCRDQIVALHDLNGDDEADFYECVENVHQTPGAGHEFITGLERDDQGRFYFSSAAQGACRVEPDGKSLKVLATNLRNPDGIAINPNGSVVLASVQEGNCTPASAICDIVEGGHYGFGGPGPGEPGFVTPMVYLPRGEDSSSGGDTYIDSTRWGPVQGNWIHFSYSMNRHFLVLREVVNGKSQAAAIPLWGEFLSGSHRGRMSPYDGQLYVAGTRGYLNYGIKDGSLQRVRYTGGGFHYPSHYEIRENGILLTFDQPQPEDLGNASLWFAQQWNYRFSLAYGSAEYSVASPDQVGHDPLAIRSVHRLDGGRQVFVEIPQLEPVNQLHLYYQGSVASERLEFFATVHNLGQPFTEIAGYAAIKKEHNTSAAELTPAALITACTACHHPTLKLVGPPLAEIRARYANNPEGIVKWALNPVRKTPNAPPMPSFYFVGEDKLRIIANEILAANRAASP